MILYPTEKQRIDWDEAVVVFVFDSDKLIGLGYALCGGEYQAAIYDVVLLLE